MTKPPGLHKHAKHSGKTGKSDKAPAHKHAAKPDKKRPGSGGREKQPDADSPFASLKALLAAD